MSDIQSESLDKFIGSFVKAQAKMQNAVLDKSNPAFKAKYASLASVREAVMLPLLECGFMVTHQMERVVAGTLLVTKIIHESGQWIGSIWPIPEEVTSNAQKMGSALTYGRRYSLASLCGIAAEEDDDGAHASGRNSNGPQPDGSLPIYQELVKSLRAATNEEELHAWQAASKPARATLNETYRNMIVEMAKEHKRGFATQAPIETPAKKLSLAERAIQAEKDRVAPMPNDEIPY